MTPLEEFNKLKQSLSPKSIINKLNQFISEDRKKNIGKILDSRISSVRVAALDTYDPHNLWAMLRTCEAMGVQHLAQVAPQEKAAVSMSVSAGAKDWINLDKFDDFESFNKARKKNKFKLYGAALYPSDKLVNLEDLDISHDFYLLFGNEDKGLPKEVIAECDQIFKIPMYGVTESYNLSVSAAISLYELLKQKRKQKKSNGDLSSERKEELLAWHMFRNLDARHRRVMINNLNK